MAPSESRALRRFGFVAGRTAVGSAMTAKIGSRESERPGHVSGRAKDQAAMNSFQRVTM